MITAYPLSWPIDRSRTKHHTRLRGKFAHDGKKISVSRATRRVTEQLSRFTRVGRNFRVPSDSVIISTDIKLRKDGLPFSSARIPDDPGVAVYFCLDGDNMVISIDTYKSLADNMAAIAATVESMRTLDRHGSGIMVRAFTGFKSLPNPDRRRWRDVMGDIDDIHEVERRYKQLASERHPDKGGSAEAFAELTKARADARKEFNLC